MTVHATILAGGAGTRLWPRSRRGQPKHLLALQKGSAPLLRQTYERIRSLVDEVHVVTERSQVDSICEVLPELTPDHIIIEPVARGTASALGLAAMTLAQRDAGAHVLIDSESSLFDVPGKFVAAIGVKDLVVVESGNALLICLKSRAQEVKGLVEHLRLGEFAEYA